MKTELRVDGLKSVTVGFSYDRNAIMGSCNSRVFRLIAARLVKDINNFIYCFRHSNGWISELQLILDGIGTSQTLESNRIYRVSQKKVSIKNF